MPAGDLSGLSILLIDNNRAIRNVLKILLRGLGVNQIYEGHAGDDALVLARTSRADLALIDHELSDMSGLELTRRFRLDPLSPNPDLPIILLAPHAQPYMLEKLQTSGANSYLPKPVNARTLRERIGAVLTASSLNVGLSQQAEMPIDEAPKLRAGYL
jgi:CheY-like chemotaxis protein